MKVKLKIGDKDIIAKINDSAAAKDFISLLPLTLPVEDFGGREKICYLPRKLSTKGAPSGCDPDVGDVTYYAPWGNLAIFYKDYGYSNGLIALGKIESGIEALNVSGNVKMTIEIVK